MQLTIRKFHQADRQSLVQLWETVFPGSLPRNAPEKMIDTKLAVDDLIFVAEQDKRIVGACIVGYDGHRGWLYSVAVLPEYRHGGIGTGLIKHAIEFLKELGCVKVNLQILPNNKAVAAFYESLGFAIEDRLSMGLLIG